MPLRSAGHNQDTTVSPVAIWHRGNSSQHISRLIEVVQLTLQRVWLAYHDQEFFLAQDQFPWFRDATASQVFNSDMLDQYVSRMAALFHPIP